MVSITYVALGMLIFRFATGDPLPVPLPPVQNLVDPFCLRVLPLPLLVVNPTFTVYTRNNSHRFSLPSHSVAEPIIKELGKNGYFKKDRQVTFIVHGYFGHLACPAWIVDMKDALLTADDSTVITVYWPLGADNPDYGISVATTQTVSSAIATVAKAIAELNVFEENSADPYMYCIGHSLGAHICGQAGRKAKTPSGTQLFDRVTGLDPSGPGFEMCTDHLNIDKDSAKCVDIIHTGGSLKGNTLPLMYLGSMKQYGHIDFYPNGGTDQPSCSIMQTDTLCDHMTATQYFTLSVRKRDACGAVGVCTSVNDMPGSCGKVSQTMGYYSSCYRGASEKLEGKFYVEMNNGGSSSECKVSGFQEYCSNLKGVLP